jgi:hypothetical protein
VKITPYGASFFNEQAAGSARSAEIIAPLISSLVNPQSVIDVGCGIGTWVAAFRAAGIPTVEGMDGDYVDRSMLRFPETAFRPVDLREPLRSSLRYDLAVCLEVAEHLPESRAEGLVEDLISLAPAVLFSAAIPGQGGTEHINEQHLSYWTEKFLSRGYIALDAVRPTILGDPRVEWWYQQNIVLFVSNQSPLVRRGIPLAKGFVHPFLYDQHRELGSAPPLRHVVRMLVPASKRAMQNRLRRSGARP